MYSQLNRLAFCLAVVAGLLGVGILFDTLRTKSQPDSSEAASIQNTNPAEAMPAELETEYKVEVDPQAITSWDDYYLIKNQIWFKWDQRKSRALIEFEQENSRVWSEYAKFERKELGKAKESDPEAYVVWAAAERDEDFVRQEKIEKTSPAFVRFRNAVKPKFEECLKKYEELETRHQARLASIESVYEKERQIVEEVYIRIRRGR